MTDMEMLRKRERKIYKELDKILQEEIDNYIIEKIMEAGKHDLPKGTAFFRNSR